MSRLSSLLRAAASQIQLSSPLGRWAQAISDAVAAVTSDASYIVTQRSTTTQAFNAAGLVVLNKIAEAGGITYDTSTGIYTLRAGNLYSLQFFGLWSNFGTPATDNLDYNWFNVDLGGTVAGSGGGYAASLGNTADNAFQPVSSGLYRPVTDTRVAVKVLDITGSAQLQPGAYALVRRVG